MIMYSIYVKHDLHAVFIDYSVAFDYVMSLYKSTGSKDVVLYKTFVGQDGHVAHFKICSSNELFLV